MIAIVLVLAQQAGALPTVGDTVWISRSLSVPAGVTVRPRPIAASAVAEPLGPPEVSLIEGQVRVRYPLVAWQPGRHAIEVPGAILVRSDGWSDTLPASTATIEVGSVLPDVPRDSLKPQAALAPVPRSRRSLLPALLLGLLSLGVVLPLYWWWGRRGPVGPRPRPGGLRGPTDAMLASWMEAGEYRSAIEGWYWRLARYPGASDSGQEGESLVERLGEARFAPIEPARAQALCGEAAAWLSRRSAP
jgi:hypothetical protein